MMCSIGPGDVSVHALVATAAAKLGARLGIDEDFGAFCAGRGAADVAVLESAFQAHMLARQRASLEAP